MAGRGLLPGTEPPAGPRVSRAAACVLPVGHPASRPARGWGGVRRRGEALAMLALPEQYRV